MPIYVDHSKYLLEKGEKWFSHGCLRPSSCHLSPEPFSARVLFPAYVHSDVHPRLGLMDKPRSPAQGCTSHSGSTAHHRGPWSVHSSDQNCCCHTCNRPPETGCWSLGSQEAEPLKASGCLSTDSSCLRTQGSHILVLFLPVSTEHLLDLALGWHIPAQRHTVL